MPTKQGDISLLQDPIAQELLQSTIPARLAYIGLDGSPRVVPIWFHWDGNRVVLGTPPTAPKIKALVKNPMVALTIDTNNWPHRVLQMRGKAEVATVEGLIPEYVASAKRYFGDEQGQAWTEQIKKMFSRMVRIAITPNWVSLIDFERRFPSTIEKAMG
jgi:hypothetical protein